MGTQEGGVHVLKMNFNRVEDSCSDVVSSSSDAHSRPSTPVEEEHGLEHAVELLVSAPACCAPAFKLRAEPPNRWGKEGEGVTLVVPE